MGIMRIVGTYHERERARRPVQPGSFRATVVNERRRWSTAAS